MVEEDDEDDDDEKVIPKTASDGRGQKHSKNALLLLWKNLKIDFFKNLSFKFKDLLRHDWPHVWLCHHDFRKILTFFHNSKALGEHCEYSNTSQTRGSKLAKFSNSRFRSLLLRP